MACTWVSGLAGEMLQRLQRLLKVRHRLTVCRMGHSLDPSLAAGGHGLVPHLAPQGVVRQPVDLLGQPVGIQLPP